MNQQENAALTERSARRALYSCLFSIVVCAVMLFGTTFAWFTANRTSGVNTMTAANFDVTVSQTSFNEDGTYNVALTRQGGGTAAGYCKFTLSFSGTYIETYTVTYQDGTTAIQQTTPVDYSESRDCYANFSEGVNEISFTLNLTGENITGAITLESVSWGEYTGSDGAVVLRKARLMSAAPKPEKVEIFDGMSFDFGMGDREIAVSATDEQEAAKAAAEAAATEQQSEAQIPSEVEDKNKDEIANGNETDSNPVTDDKSDGTDESVVNDSDNTVGGNGESEPAGESESRESVADGET